MLCCLTPLVPAHYSENKSAGLVFCIEVYLNAASSVLLCSMSEYGHIPNISKTQTKLLLFFFFVVLFFLLSLLPFLTEAHIYQLLQDQWQSWERNRSSNWIADTGEGGGAILPFSTIQLPNFHTILEPQPIK